MAGRQTRFAGGLLVGLALLAGCGAPPDEAETPGAVGGAPAPGPAGDPDVGSFSMNLTLGGGYQIAQLGYDVSGNGFHKAGTVDVAGSTVISTVIGGIPIGTGYLLRLTAQDAGHQLMGCSGSAMFDIPSAVTVPVPVHMTCQAVTAPPVASVPVPSWTRAVVAGLLLALGALATRPRPRSL